MACSDCNCAKLENACENNKLDPRHPETWPAFLSVADLAQLFGISESAAYGMIYRHEITGKKFGKRFFVEKSVLLRYFDSDANKKAK